MTYGTPHTLLRRPTPLPPMPERVKPAPTMTWAEMARAEGHRPGFPAVPQPKTGGRPSRPIVGPTRAEGRLLDRLLRFGPMVPSIAGDRAKLPLAERAQAIAALVAAGLIREEPAPLPCHPHRVVLALTDAGRAKAEAAR